MKFLIMMSEDDHYARWDAATDAEHQAFFDGLAGFAAAVEKRGALLAGEALAHPREGRRILPPKDASAAGHRRPVTAGPFAESVEQLGGFYLVDLPDLETALEIAALLPAELVDVRPVEEYEEPAA